MEIGYIRASVDDQIETFETELLIVFQLQVNLPLNFPNSICRKRIPSNIETDVLCIVSYGNTL